MTKQGYGRSELNLSRLKLKAFVEGGESKTVEEALAFAQEIGFAQQFCGSGL
jgi:hypothetical protein